MTEQQTERTKQERAAEAETAPSAAVGPSAPSERPGPSARPESSEPSARHDEQGPVASAAPAPQADAASAPATAPAVRETASALPGAPVAQPAAAPTAAEAAADGPTASRAEAAPMGAMPVPAAAVTTSRGHGESPMPGRAGGYATASPGCPPTLRPGPAAGGGPSFSPPPPAGGGGAPAGPAGPAEKLPPLRSAPSAGPYRWIAVLVAIVGVVAMASALVPAIWSNARDSVGGTMSTHASTAGIEEVRISSHGEDVMVGFGPVEEATLDVEARGVMPGAWGFEVLGSTLHVRLGDSTAGWPWPVGEAADHGERSVRLTLPLGLQGIVGLDATSAPWGSMSIGGEFGAVRLTAVQADLSFSGAASSIEATTMSGGSLEIDAKVKEGLVVTSQAVGDVPWEWADDGSVDFSGSARNAQLDIGTGSANVEASIAETIAASATSGSLSIQLAGQPPKTTTIALESGFATLGVPRGEYQVVVPVRSGTVDSEVPNLPNAVNRISGDVGGGALTIAYATP